MILTTEPTPQQKKAKEVLDKIYGVASNLFFLGIVVTASAYFLVRMSGDLPGLLPTTKHLWEELALPAIAGVVLAIIAAFLVMLRGLLYLFQLVSATELTKFYLFIELINLGRQYLNEPSIRPTPMLVEMLNKILGL